MNAVFTPKKMTAQEYLDWESRQDIKHEYVDGDVFAMTGVRLNHNLIALNAASVLRTALAGSPCRVFVADVKIKPAQSSRFFYPDVSVTCNPADWADGNALYVQSPWFIAEVLCDSTAGFDRGKKFEYYRSIESLTHYLLIEANRPYADLFFKDERARWVLQPLEPTDTVQMEQPHAIVFSVQALFEGVTFDSPPDIATA